MLPIRPNILQMRPYVPGKPIEEVKRELGLDRVVKLASNENPFGPSPKAVEAVRAAATEMHIYPDGAAFELRAAIARKFGVDAKSVIVGNGSDELIHLLGLLFLSEPEDELMVGDPSFSRYDASAHLAAARLVKVPLDAHFVHDLAAMADAITERTRLIYIANPNNPTGTIVRRREMETFLARVPETVAIVLDEAYFEFAREEADFPNALDYVREGRPNVVALRTFSKAQGLAGIRVGYGFAPPAICDAIDRAREPFDVNRLAQVAAIAALDDDAHVARTVEHNRRGIEMLSALLREAGATPCESFGNFVYADFGRPTRPIFQALLERGVITRAGDLLGNSQCLRISIGTQDELDTFAEVFREVMATDV
jgi:histidinol-phosphate aminotransferase